MKLGLAIPVLFFLSCSGLSLNSRRQLKYPEAFRENVAKSYLKTANDFDIVPFCTSSNPSMKTSALSSLLEASQTQFATPEQRLKNPDGYVSAFNEILKVSGYDFLFKCVEDWKSVPGNSFKVTTFDISKTHDHGMQLGGDKDLDLKLDLHTSFQKTFFAYAHELLHVCQESPKRALYTQGQEQDFEQFNRSLFLGEFEAFVLMEKLYDDLLPHSRRLCFEETADRIDKSKQLYLLYAEGKKEFLAGTFPQRMFENYKEYYKSNLAGVLDLNSTVITYRASILGPEFKQKCFTPEMFKALEEDGIPIQKDDCLQK
jgi:hypothetical protein